MSSERSSSQAIVDWCSFTWYEPEQDHIGGIIFSHLAAWMSGWQIRGEQGKGLYGYDQSVNYYAITDDGSSCLLAVLAFGGDHQMGRAYLSITGTGCAFVQDWQQVKAFISSLPEYRLTRADVALDFPGGEFDLDQAATAYQQGDFNNGGRHPQYTCVGDWLQPLGLGRTLNIGKRANGKMCRVYEKGRQLGDRDSPWVRVEVEIRNVDREIPLDILTRPTDFFAGAYPICATLVKTNAEKINLIRKQGLINLNHLIEHCRNAYGKMLNVIKSISPQVDDAFDLLSTPGIPSRLDTTMLDRDFFIASRRHIFGESRGHTS